MTITFQLTRPDDWHIHVRSGSLMRSVVGPTAACFGRALIMPNLIPPVTNAEQAENYRDSILEALPEDSKFDPVMTLYLTDSTSLETVQGAAESAHVCGFKLYPAGATTNSESGVTSISRVMPILEAMADQGLVLQVHGEVTDSHVDIFDRESEFIDQVLIPLRKEIPELRIVFEHITSSQAVEYVLNNDNIGATITPHHLMYSRNDIFAGGIRPHYYCLPILKRREHMLALLQAATSGNSKFFLGTDSAPHVRAKKENSCGCAGIYSAHTAIEFYAEVFEAMDALDKLEGFASFYGADFYGVARNQDQITLQQSDWVVPEFYQIEPEGNNDDAALWQLVPLRAGETLRWKLVP
ncbi:MAG: dihydroorotase [bacterium]